MKQLKHWQDPVNALLGAWLVISPWVLGFAQDMTVMGNMVIVGVLLIAAALGAIFLPRAWEEWTEAALGLFMVVSPWLLGFATMQAAMISAVVTGLVVLALALWVLTTDKEYSGWWTRMTA